MSRGYHRDPRHYSNISVLESEMRRRTWAFIMQMDLLLSGKCGLPRAVDERQADTLPPLNVLDEDLNEDMTEPPEDRSVSEPTSVAYLSYKTRLLAVQGRISDRINSPKGLTYEEVLQLDKDLMSQIATKPAWLEPLECIERTGPWRCHLNQVIEMDLIVQRARMILHRKYLIPAHTLQRYASSRDICLEAAQKVLQHQRALSENPMNTRPDPGNWRFMSLMSHDFLLAAVLVCLDIDRDLRIGKSATSVTSEGVGGKEARLERLNLLQQSHQAWSGFQSQSGVADKATRTLGIMLDRLRQAQEPNDRPMAALGDGPESQWPANHSDVQSQLSTDSSAPWVQEVPPHISDATESLDAGQISKYFQNSTQAPHLNGTDFYHDFSNIDNMLISPHMDIDWSAWDAQYFGTMWNLQ